MMRKSKTIPANEMRYLKIPRRRFNLRRKLILEKFDKREKEKDLKKIKKMGSPMSPSKRRNLSGGTKLTTMLQKLRFLSVQSEENTLNIYDDDYKFNQTISVGDPDSSLVLPEQFDAEEFLEDLSEKMKLDPTRKLNIVTDKIKTLETQKRHDNEIYWQISLLQVYGVALIRMIFGENSIEYVKMLIELSRNYVRQGKVKNAVPHLKHGLKVVTEILSRKSGPMMNLDEEHVKLLPNILVSLAQVQLQIKMMKNAFACLKEAQRQDQLIFSSEGPASFDILATFAQFYVDRKRFGKAQEYLDAARSHLESHQGMKESLWRERNAKLSMEESRIHLVNKDYDQAIECMTKCVKLYDRGNVAAKTERVKRAEEEEASGEQEEDGELDMSEKEKVIVAQLTSKVACLYFTAKDLFKSVVWFGKVVTLNEELYGSLAIKTLSAMEKYTFIMMELGNQLIKEPRKRIPKNFRLLDSYVRKKEEKEVIVEEEETFNESPIKKKKKAQSPSHSPSPRTPERKQSSDTLHISLDAIRDPLDDMDDDEHEKDPLDDIGDEPEEEEEGKFNVEKNEDGFGEDNEEVDDEEDEEEEEEEGEIEEGVKSDYSQLVLHKAIEKLLDLLQRQTEVYGNESKKVTASLVFLGDCYCGVDEFEMAFLVYERALVISSEIYFEVTEKNKRKLMVLINKINGTMAKMDEEKAKSKRK